MMSDKRQQFVDELTALSRKYGFWLHTNNEGEKWYGVKIIPDLFWETNNYETPACYTGRTIDRGDITWLELRWSE